MSDNLTTSAADPMDRIEHNEADPNPCPPLTVAEYEALKRSIQDDGFIPAFPVLISAGPAFEGRIIDGHHRSQVCAELGVQPVVLHHPCATDLEFKILQIKANLERRQLSTAQRAVLAVRLLPLYEERAADRRSATLKQNATDPTPVSEREQGEAVHAVAQTAGVSGTTIKQMRAIMASAQADVLLDAIQTQGKSIKATYQSLRPEKEQAKLDTSISNEAAALAEIEEHSTQGSPPEHIGARDRAVGESIRLAIELDRLLQRHALIPDEVSDYTVRPHTFRGTVGRLKDWFLSLEDML